MINSDSSRSRVPVQVLVFVAFVKDNATMSSIRYCENHAKPREVDPIRLISLRQISLSMALNYIINNSVREKKKPNRRIDDCNSFFYFH